MNKYLVSVIIPTYRRPENLKRAINSVINQSYENLEIIVVDDNCSDSNYRLETETLMSEIQDRRLIYLKHDINKNGAAARNTGIKYCSGDYITFLDDDDEMRPYKIERQVESFSHYSEDYGISYTNFTRKYGNKVIGMSTDNREGNLSIDLLLGRLYLSAGSNIMIKRGVIKKVIGFDESYLRRQDLEFFVRASEHFKTIYVDYDGLIVHKDDPSNAKSLNIDQYIENTEKFISDFKYMEIYMNQKEKNKFRQSQYLMTIRSLLLKKEFKMAKILMNDNNISMFLVFRFIMYSIKRKVSKKIYGFKI